jgi:arginase
MTSPSGNMHGMPVAAVLNIENGAPAGTHPDPEIQILWEKMRHFGGIYPKIMPEDVVFVGIRDLEEQEWENIRRLGIRYFDNHAVNRLGADSVAQQTLAMLDHCDAVYVTFDVDSLDAALVPGTGTPVPDGLSPGQARLLLDAFWNCDRLACLEVTEINPLLDMGNRTAETAAKLLRHVLREYFD